MSLEPAIALVMGLVLLHQVPGLWPVLGVGFVVAAGIGAERTGARDHAVGAAVGSEPPASTVAP
jgi:inner membrane transporter RhtA